MNIQKKSLHYRLARVYGNLRVHSKAKYDNNHNHIGYEEFYDGDICEYCRHIVKGIIKLIFISVVSLVCCIPMVFSLAWFTACLTTGTWFKPDGEDDAPIVIGLVVWLILIALLCCYICVTLYSKYRKRYPKKIKPVSSTKSEPGFLSVAYEKFKTKTCSRVIIK